MPADAFTHAWALAYLDQINQRPSYRQAAAEWEADVALVMAAADGIEERAIYLDLWHGECRAARSASAADLERAKYVLSATPAHWRQVLSGEVAPLLAMMTGKLTLSRGSLGSLLPYMKAARELVVAGMSVDTAFPSESR